jgi:hypothetical protein
MVRLLTRCNLSLNLIECDEFRALLTYLNQDLADWLPASKKTITQWVLRTVDDQINTQITNIANAKSKIHLWIDGWTSTNRLSVLAVGCSYMGADNKIHTVLLSLDEIDGSHTGANLAGIVFKTISKYLFAHNLGYCIMDNAANNDTMMRELSNRKFNALDPSSISPYSRPRLSSANRVKCWKRYSGSNGTQNTTAFAVLVIYSACQVTISCLSMTKAPLRRTTTFLLFFGADRSLIRKQ